MGDGDPNFYGCGANSFGTVVQNRVSQVVSDPEFLLHEPKSKYIKYW